MAALQSKTGEWSFAALLCLIMSFTYDFTSAPLIANVRLLISDTVNNPPTQPAIFSDEEITAFYNIQASQFQSSQFYSFPGGRDLPSTPVSYLRVAALALDSLASNFARLSGVLQVLDVKIDAKSASQSLRDQAKGYREVDDDAGAFAVIEQCTTQWNFQDRYWYQVMRQSGGALG